MSTPSLILSSPYRRAVETAAVAAEVLGYKGEIVRTGALTPEASPYDTWEEIRDRKDERSILLASHEPLMSSMAAFLLDSPALMVDMKKAALVRIDCDRIGPKPHGILKWMLTPGVSPGMNIVKATAKYEAWLATPPEDRRTRISHSSTSRCARAVSLSCAPPTTAGRRSVPEVCAEAAKAPEGAGGRRSARGELRDLARHRRPPDLGHQRFRRSLALALHQRPDPPRHQRADGGAWPASRRPESTPSCSGYIDRSKPAAARSRWPSITPSLRTDGHRPPARSRSGTGTKLHALPDSTEEPPAGALKAIARMMPERGLHWRVAHRIAGLGSLGRQRYVALAEWRGGTRGARGQGAGALGVRVGGGGKGTAPILYQEMLNTPSAAAIRSCACRNAGSCAAWRPTARASSSRALPKERDEMRLLHAMGWETANVHLGRHKPRTLLADLKKRPRGWLLKAARAMEKAVLADFKAYSAQ